MSHETAQKPGLYALQLNSIVVVTHSRTTNLLDFEVLGIAPYNIIHLELYGMFEVFV
jgi:hypothetical protein